MGYCQLFGWSGFLIQGQQRKTLQILSPTKKASGYPEACTLNHQQV